MTPPEMCEACIISDGRSVRGTRMFYDAEGEGYYWLCDRTDGLHGDREYCSGPLMMCYHSIIGNCDICALPEKAS